VDAEVTRTTKPFFARSVRDLQRTAKRSTSIGSARHQKWNVEFRAKGLDLHICQYKIKSK